MLNQSYKGYLDRRDIPMILKSSQIIADAMPFNAKANYRAGRQLMQQKRPYDAKHFFARAVLEEPENKAYLKALAKANQSVN